MLSAVQPLGSTRVVSCRRAAGWPRAVAGEMLHAEDDGVAVWLSQRLSMSESLAARQLGRRAQRDSCQRTQNAEMQDVDNALVPPVRAMLWSRALATFAE